MRTTPLNQWREQASKFDGMIRAATEKILGFPMDDPTFAQASLTPRLGGLGLRKVVRGAQRLRRAAQPHACGFITAVPSDEDGKETLLRPRIFQTAVAYRLGVPVVDKEIPCPL